MEQSKNIKLNAGIYTIHPSETVKILGYYLNINLNHDTYINKIISKVNYRLLLLKDVSKYMCSNVKVLVYNAIIISVIVYVIPLIIDLNSKQLNVINVLVNKVARYCMGYKSFRWNNTTLMRKCGWLGGTHLIYYGVLCFIHKINFENLPESLTNLFIYKDNLRGRYTRCPSSTKHKAISKITRDNLFSRGLLYYKKIPDILKTYNIKKFKREVKIYIKENLPPDKLKIHTDYD